MLRLLGFRRGSSSAGPRRAPGCRQSRRGPFETRHRQCLAHRLAGRVEKIPGLTDQEGREKRWSRLAGPAHSLSELLLVATLVAGFAKQLAVLLLRHTLATLFDNGAH